jgi:hypothetical protein
MCQSVAELSVPSDAEVVGKDMERTARNEGLSNGRPNWDAGTFRPLKNLSCGGLFRMLGSTIAEFVPDGLKNKFPFLH